MRHIVIYKQEFLEFFGSVMTRSKEHPNLKFWFVFIYFLFDVTDIHREKAPSNKTPALRKSTNMGIWAVGTLNQLFIRGS